MMMIVVCRMHTSIWPRKVPLIGRQQELDQDAFLSMKWFWPMRTLEKKSIRNQMDTIERR